MSVFLIVGCRFRSQVASDNPQTDSTAAPETVEPMVSSETADTVDLGDKFGNYYVRHSVVTNDLIASIYPDTTIMNNSLFLTVHYKDKLILDNLEIRSTYFKEIENASQFILVTQGFVEFKEVNDTLVVGTEMCVCDTDWGYDITLKISNSGNISYKTINYDDYPREEDY